VTLSADEQVEQLRRMANDRVVTLIERAKAGGTLREDFAGEDLVLRRTQHGARPAAA
jgi:hypothetical protein